MSERADVNNFLVQSVCIVIKAIKYSYTTSHPVLKLFAKERSDDVHGYFEDRRSVVVEK